MKRIHLLASLASMLLLAAGLSAGILYAHRIERYYVHALAPQLLDLNLTGSALQKAASEQPDLLLVYGSSELTHNALGYTAREVFRTYPTGFAPFEVAQGGVTALILAQAVAAVGPDLKGKKIIISFTPTVFSRPMVDPDTYAGLFSKLHANELAFSTRLSFATKQAAAWRMLKYPKTLKGDRMLHFALERLADGSSFSRMLYWIVWPLGKAHTLVIELQDHWQTIRYIWSQKNLNPHVLHRPVVINWHAFEAKAEQVQISYANNNPYGIDNKVWSKRYSKSMKSRTHTQSDRAAIQGLQQSAEWTDLEILLRILKELDAQPLLLSRPYNGDDRTVLGVSAQARQVYYDKLGLLAKQYGMPLVDFQAHDTDKYFSTDGSSHSSRKGWAYVDEIMNEFYHGALR